MLRELTARALWVASNSCALAADFLSRAADRALDAALLIEPAEEPTHEEVVRDGPVVSDEARRMIADLEERPQPLPVETKPLVGSLADRGAMVGRKWSL